MILPRCLHEGERLWRAPQCKENQKSQNRNVLCSVVHVEQCYCLSYRMWKGFISCVVLIHLQDSVWIKFPILSVSLYTATPPLRSPLKLQYNPQAPSMVESQGALVNLCGPHLVTSVNHALSHKCTPCMYHPGPPKTTCAAKRVKMYP